MHILRVLALRFLALFAVLALSACVQQMGGQSFPQPTAGFTPKTTYNISADRAQAAVIAALNANSIPVVNVSKETGQITTDYVAGPSQLVGLGLVSADSTRYKYTIFVAPLGRKKVSISISCAMEISQSSSAGSSPFHDVSSQNTATTASLRNWLYEQIERNLQ
jgi:hypothetical protein